MAGSCDRRTAAQTRSIAAAASAGLAVAEVAAFARAVPVLPEPILLRIGVELHARASTGARAARAGRAAVDARSRRRRPAPSPVISQNVNRMGTDRMRPFYHGRARGRAAVAVLKRGGLLAVDADLAVLRAGRAACRCSCPGRTARLRPRRRSRRRRSAGTCSRARSRPWCRRSWCSSCCRGRTARVPLTMPSPQYGPYLHSAVQPPYEPSLFLPPHDGSDDGVVVAAVALLGAGGDAVAAGGTAVRPRWSRTRSA